MGVVTITTKVEGLPLCFQIFSSLKMTRRRIARNLPTPLTRRRFLQSLSNLTPNVNWGAF
jgi:hypothetical protein